MNNPQHRITKSLILNYLMQTDVHAISKHV